MRWYLSTRVGAILCPLQSKVKKTSLALPGRDGPQIVLMTFDSDGSKSLGRRGTISAACKPVAVIIVEMTSHRRSKFPCAPCTLPSKLHALATRLRINGPEQVASVVRTPAPKDLNSVEMGKGTPCNLVCVCVCVCVTSTPPICGELQGEPLCRYIFHSPTINHSATCATNSSPHLRVLSSCNTKHTQHHHHPPCEKWI